MEKLEIYNQLKDVPESAKKKITGGRLNGMTDIKPMWRIEKLTETFGMVGIGWYTETTKKEIIDGANDEKIAVVDINLYVNINGEWSKPIEGSGGSSFVAKEKNGLYTSDECFKMAYTDALSVACKSLGMGANVYWGDSKYTTTPKELTEEDAKNYQITFGKHKGTTLQELIQNDPDYIDWIINNSKDETLLKAIEMLTGQVKQTDEQLEENMYKIQKIMSYEMKGLDVSKILTAYKVSGISQMKPEQLDDCLNKLNKKYGE